MTANNTRKEKFLMLLVMMLVAAPLALAVDNNPGHDTLYVLKIGSSNVIGSINISENLTARFVRVTSKFFGDYLDILANGSATITNPPTTTTIQAALDTLYIDSTGYLYINSLAGTSSIVQIGGNTTNLITLDVRGEIKRQGVNVPIEGRCNDTQVLQNLTATGSQCRTIANVSSANSADNADTVDLHHVTASTDNRLVKHSTVNLADSGISDASDAIAITIDASENVGIRTNNPNTTLSVNGGAIEVNYSNMAHYRNVVQNGSKVATVTGTMVITMPKNWSSTMMIVRIVGFQYSSAVLGQWEVVVSGYNAGTQATWYYTKAEIRGRAPFNSVRLANDGSYNVILLGNTTTAWAYPQIAVTDFIAGYGSVTGWGSGWTITNTTDETAMINISTPTIDMYTDSSGNVGINTTAPGAKLDIVGGNERIYNSGTDSATGLIIGNHTSISSNTGGLGLQMYLTPSTKDLTIRNVYWGVSYEPIIVNALNFTVSTGSGSISEGLVVSSTGKVGVGGTTVPEGSLHVAKNIIIEATTTDHNITNDANNDLLIDAGTGGDVIIRIG
ncbi:MAG: hypothetical protein V1866_00425 [archaeon]